MITIIFGAPGSGKSSLNTYFLKELYRAQGKQLLEAACDRRRYQRKKRAGKKTIQKPSAQRGRKK